MENLVFCLTCEDGFEVQFCSIGASIRQILTPCGEGRRNIVLSPADDQSRFTDGSYAGATLAPAAGRISNGLLPLGMPPSPRDFAAALSRNENGIHTLHGGAHNASFQVWEADGPEEKDGASAITFRLFMEDGLDGFPGNRQLSVTYTLEESNPQEATPAHTLTIRYRAVSDRQTYFNLSNHTYFNLSGDFSGSALNHEVSILADRYIASRPDFIPEEIRPVAGTPFDFRSPVSPETQMKRFPDDLQIRQNCGYNHGFLLNHKTGGADLICAHPKSPVILAASSDAPCMIFYSGGYLENTVVRTAGTAPDAACRAVPSCALAFEFQDYPDAPGGHGFPYRLTPPDTVWSRTIRYQFLLK